MHLLDQRIAGTIILLLWAMLLVAKGMATGSLLKDRPQSGVRMWLTHIFNFLFLLVATPLVAIALIIRRPQALDPTPLALGTPGLRAGIWVAGVLLYAAGCILLAWALFTLRGNYQVGGMLLAPQTSWLRAVHIGSFGTLCTPPRCAFLWASRALPIRWRTSACSAFTFY